jgi:hypothetical protein
VTEVRNVNSHCGIRVEGLSMQNSMGELKRTKYLNPILMELDEE